MDLLLCVVKPYRGSCMKNITLAFVTDIHAGKLIEHRPGQEAIGLLSSFISIIQERDIDAVIELGDRVNNEDHDRDLQNLNAVRDKFTSLKVPRYSILGNHDMHYLSKDENKEILSLPALYYSVNIGGFTCLFLDTADPIWGHCGGTVSKQQLDWLTSEVQKDNRPKLVFGHHPATVQNQTGNPFFVDIPGEETLKNYAQVQHVLENGKHVIGYFNGHVHWFHVCRVRQIPYVSLPSLLESYPEKEHAPGRYTLAEFSEDGIIDLSFHTIHPRRTIGRIVL